MIESCSSAQYQSFWFMLAVSNPMGFLAQKVIHPRALSAAFTTCGEGFRTHKTKSTHCIMPPLPPVLMVFNEHGTGPLAHYLARACCRRRRQLGAPRVYDGVNYRVQLLHRLLILQVAQRGQPLWNDETQGRTPCKVLKRPLDSTCMHWQDLQRPP